MRDASIYHRQGLAHHVPLISDVGVECVHAGVSALPLITADVLTDSYDHSVIGGGSAAALVAARPPEDSECRVLLIEAGDASGDRLSTVDRLSGLRIS